MVAQAELMKRCPRCAEAILAAALKCKHCGSDVSPRTPLTAGRVVMQIITVLFFAAALGSLAYLYKSCVDNVLGPFRSESK